MYTSETTAMFSSIHTLSLNGKVIGLLYGTKEEIENIVMMLNTHPLND